MTADDLDYIRQLASSRRWTVTELYEQFADRRRRGGMGVPHLTSFRKALKGITYRRGVSETRGRKRKLQAKTLQRIDEARKRLITRADGEQEVHWSDVIKRARVEAHPTTVRRNLRAAGIDVQWRTPRQKPLRPTGVVEERLAVAKRWRRYPARYFTETLDLMIDNKQWAIPTSSMARRHANARKVRGHLRTRSEGLDRGFTKPHAKKHRVNPGASVLVCAGIINCRVRLWHYLPKGRWSGAVAAATYSGPIARALTRFRGHRTCFKVLEDNDPTGYKSKEALAAKRAAGIRAIQFPRYSPDLNPMDYFLWSEIERRMVENAPRGKESVEQYKARLRRTAMRLPEAVVRKGVADLKRRAQFVYAAEGGDIACD